MLTSSLLALAGFVATTSATFQGFNYGSTFTTGAAKQEADFLAEFQTAQGLVGTNNAFTSARLYTMVQAGTANSPISAIPAAIASKTSLLLGLWASAGQANIDSEIAALTAAIKQYGAPFTSLIAGISVGSEDLYRNSPTGIINMSGVGANPADLVTYIKQVRAAIAGTSAASAPVGHVDTWTAWVNGSNADVIANCDFLGMDAYPYFQTTQANAIENNHELFFEAYNATIAVSNGKSVWVTETGYPVSGPTAGQAVPSIANAKTFWDNTACELFGNVNTWYYTLQDAAPTTPSPSFGIVGSTLSTTPLFDLTCPAKAVASSSSSSTVSATKPATVTSSVAYGVAPTTTSVPAKDSTTSVPAKDSTTSVPAKDSTTSVPAKDSTTSVPAKDSTTSVPAKDSTTSIPAKDSTTSVPAKDSTSSAAPTASVPAKDSTTVIQPTQTGDVTITITSTVYGTASVCSTALDTTVTVKSTAYVTTTCASCSTSAPVVSVSSSKASSSVPASSSAPVVSASSSQATSSAPATSVVSSSSVSSTASSASVTSSAPATSVVSSSTVSSKTSSAPATSSTACPTDLNGTYQYPHLIVPVSSASPNTAYGTQYFPVISSTVSTIFNFDIPASYAGQTCSLVFLFPEKKDLETADYTYSAAGGIAASQLASVATNATTYANKPKAAAQLTSIPALSAGNGYVVASGPCAAGQAVSYELSSTSGLNLTYFEDWNPSPLGLFVRVC